MQKGNEIFKRPDVEGAFACNTLMDECLLRALQQHASRFSDSLLFLRRRFDAHCDVGHLIPIIIQRWWVLHDHCLCWLAAGSLLRCAWVA